MRFLIDGILQRLIVYWVKWGVPGNHNTWDFKYMVFDIIVVMRISTLFSAVMKIGMLFLVVMRICMPFFGRNEDWHAALRSY